MPQHIPRASSASLDERHTKKARRRSGICLLFNQMLSSAPLSVSLRLVGRGGLPMGDWLPTCCAAPGSHGAGLSPPLPPTIAPLGPPSTAGELIRGSSDCCSLPTAPSVLNPMDGLTLGKFAGAGLSCCCCCAALLDCTNCMRWAWFLVLGDWGAGMPRAPSARGVGDAAAAVAKCSSKRLWGWNERMLACDGSACKPWSASSSLLSS